MGLRVSEHNQIKDNACSFRLGYFFPCFIMIVSVYRQWQYVLCIWYRKHGINNPTCIQTSNTWHYILWATVNYTACFLYDLPISGVAESFMLCAVQFTTQLLRVSCKRTGRIWPKEMCIGDESYLGLNSGLIVIFSLYGFGFVDKCDTLPYTWCRFKTVYNLDTVPSSPVIPITTWTQ